MENQKCGLSICQGQEISREEQLQQKNAYHYAMQMRGSQHSTIDGHQNGYHPKSVFSFRLNCTRNYSHSDKNKLNLAQNKESRLHPDAVLHQCKSLQRLPFNPIQEKISQQFSPRSFPCPPPPILLESGPVFRGNTLRNPSILGMKWAQKENKPCIRFVTSNQHCFSQAIDTNSKNSADTQYSSIQSQFQINQCEISSPAFRKESQTVRLQQPFPQSKLSFQKSFLELRSNSCIPEQIVYPSFDKLQYIEPRKFFENATTLKTIFTQNELREQSVANSFKEMAAHSKRAQQAEVQGLAGKTSKHFASRNKKRTAYFGYGERENETGRRLAHRQMELDEDAAQEQHNPQKKVHFLVQSRINCSRQQNLQASASASAKQIQKPIYEPSLHHIIQSAQKEQKISIQNSVREMPLFSPESVQECALRLRYVNTIKSIGGESFQSQNSYLDLKFMQNLNSRRAVVKLV